MIDVQDPDSYNWCVGVGSYVRAGTGTNIGHVCQLDLEGPDRQGVEYIIREKLDSDVWLLFDCGSKEGQPSWHVSGLRIRRRHNVADLKAGIAADDPLHLKVGLDRGYWILRTSGKGDRAAPEAVRAFDTTDNEADSLQGDNSEFIPRLRLSMPHIRLYDTLGDTWDLQPFLASHKYECAGMKLSHEKYPTQG